MLEELGIYVRLEFGTLSGLHVLVTCLADAYGSDQSHIVFRAFELLLVLFKCQDFAGNPLVAEFCYWRFYKVSVILVLC
jgi:hypothetical protein